MGTAKKKKPRTIEQVLRRHGVEILRLLKLPPPDAMERRLAVEGDRLLAVDRELSKLLLLLGLRRRAGRHYGADTTVRAQVDEHAGYLIEDVKAGQLRGAKARRKVEALRARLDRAIEATGRASPVL